MTLKTIVLAGAAALTLAAPLAIPAAASAQPYGHQAGWRHEGGFAVHGWGYGPRCGVEQRGFYDAWGHYGVQDVRVCR